MELKVEVINNGEVYTYKFEDISSLRVAELKRLIGSESEEYKGSYIIIVYKGHVVPHDNIIVGDLVRFWKINNLILFLTFYLSVLASLRELTDAVNTYFYD